MQEDKDKVVDLFSHHSTDENPQRKDDPSPAIQFNAPVTGCHFTQYFHKTPDSPAETSCAEAHRLESAINRLESLLKNKCP